MTVLAADHWRTNAEMIADVAKLGYLNGKVLDCTYGLGNFWTMWEPDELVGCDIDVAKSPIGQSIDFRRLHLYFPAYSFDSVVFDPPYKLNGTPDVMIDERYGVEQPRTIDERHGLMMQGVSSCSRVLRLGGCLLVKCQDQVASGRIHWQTDLMTHKAGFLGMRKVDRFDMLGHHRKQPMEGRKQRHAHGRPSTLLVFKKEI